MSQTSLFYSLVSLQVFRIPTSQDLEYALTVPSAFIVPVAFQRLTTAIQVILAFLITAYVTWATVAIGYCCGWIDENLLGEFDRRILRVKARPSDLWSPLLVKVVLMLRWALPNVNSDPRRIKDHAQ